MITISACIITRNEPERIKATILHVYPYVDEIIVNDGSDSADTFKEIIPKEFKFKIKYFKTEPTLNFAEERNKMHEWANGDYCLHIDTDERFDIKFLKSMKNIIEKSVNDIQNPKLPILFRFPRKGDENDISKNPDYQIRLMNRIYSKWTRSVHEIPIIIRQDKYFFNNKEFVIKNLTPLDNFLMIHLPKDRKERRKRWDIFEHKDSSFTQRNLLICTMFKDSELWINDFIKCIEDAYYYNENINHNDNNNHNDNVNCDSNNKLKIRIAFLDSKSKDNTSKIIKDYITSTPILYIIYKYYEYLKHETTRYSKLADIRNHLITTSIHNIYNNNLKDDDLILFIDSDIKFNENIINELTTDMNKYNADIIAPLVCIEDYKSFKNNYFYDTLAFRNIDNEQFSHFRPYIFGDIKRSKIKKEKHEKIQKALEKIDTLNTLRKINWEFNMNNPLNTSFPDNLYNEAFSLIDFNTPIQVNSVGSFYIMKYKVAKNVKYTGEHDSEQVEFMNTARSKGYKIFVSQRLKVLHVNLEKYGLQWH